MKKPVTLKQLIRRLAKLDHEGLIYARIVVETVGALDDPRETHSALMSAVAYEMPKRMLKVAARAESVLVCS